MRTIFKVLLLTLTLLCTSVASGKSSEDDAGMSASSHSEAAQIATQRFGGKVLKVELENGNRNAKYRVKLITKDGTVRIVTVAASQKE